MWKKERQENDSGRGKKCTRERERKLNKDRMRAGNRKCGRRKWGEEGKRRGRDRKCVEGADALFPLVSTCGMTYCWSKNEQKSHYLFLLPLGKVWSLIWLSALSQISLFILLAQEMNYFHTYLLPAAQHAQIKLYKYNWTVDNSSSNTVINK